MKGKYWSGFCNRLSYETKTILGATIYIICTYDNEVVLIIYIYTLYKYTYIKYIYLYHKKCDPSPDWEILRSGVHLLERLVSLGMMGFQLRASHSLSQYDSAVMFRGPSIQYP